MQEPEVVPLGALPVAAGEWGAWAEAGACSVTCAAGIITMQRSCNIGGACSGDYREDGPCNPGACREYQVLR